MDTDIHVSEVEALAVNVNVYPEELRPFATVELRTADGKFKLFIGLEHLRQVVATVLDELREAAPKCQGVGCHDDAVVMVTWYNPERDLELDHQYCQLHADRIVEVKVDHLVVTATPLSAVRS